jgi:CBS domain-containing protein
MKITRFMTKHVWTCRREDSLHRAAQLMWEHDLGALPIVDADERVVGMVTDRDLCMAAYTQSRALSEISVASVMSRPVVTCQEDQDAEDVAQQMAAAQVRRIPIVSQDGKLRGIMSLHDLALAMLRGPEMSAVDVVETLAAVCERRRRLNAA